ncbi:hypothetical protein HMPREF1579_01122 [Gardnerella vaginalis JCP8066]|nr:hypothetical protein HMPREF1579_01122 [Gardnerella vaginalis JCP8066]
MPTRVVGLDSKQSARVGYLDISCLVNASGSKKKELKWLRMNG